MPALEAEGMDGLLPPPSTLAAQLVESIPAAGAASSSTFWPNQTTDEAASLLAAVERIKNQPSLLSTDAERVEHNHMLIYLYGTVVLDNLLDWDAPVANHPLLRTEILKAVSFFRLTISETPAILHCTTDGRTYLLRGKEPLWLWLLPKVLRFLGRDECEPIRVNIMSFCAYLVNMTAQEPMWHGAPVLIKHFQDCFDVILGELKSTSLYLGTPNPHIELPPKPFVDGLVKDGARGCQYVIRGYRHALQHAVGLLTLIGQAVLLRRADGIADYCLQIHTGQVLDSLASLTSLEQKAWRPQNWAVPSVSPAPLLRMVVDLIVAHGESSGAAALCQKLCTELTQICCIVLRPPRSLSTLSAVHGDDLTDSVCLALVQLAKGIVDKKVTLRLVETDLAKIVRQIWPQEETANAGEGTADRNRDSSLFISSDIWRASKLFLQAVSDPSGFALSEPFLPDEFKGPQVRHHVVRLFSRRSTGPAPDERAPKRRKVSHEANILTGLLDRFRDTFAFDLKKGPKVTEKFLDAFSKMEDDSKCHTIELLSHLVCYADGALKYSDSQDPEDFQCPFCAAPGFVDTMPIPQLQPGNAALKAWALDVFPQILTLDTFANSERPRVVAMAALRSLIQHCPGSKPWDLEKSDTGQWCLKSLQSSVRELRYAAGRALAIFVRGPALQDLRKDVVERNGAYAFGMLKGLVEKNVPHLHESCVIAWSQIGRVVSEQDKELNFVLLKLLESLDHANPTVSDFALNEIKELAEARKVTPTRLFQPFWDTLAFTVLKDLPAKPQATQMVARLLEVDVPALLRMLQQHALPWLVVNKRRDVVQKIAEARGETETWSPCVDPKNLPPILAKVLIQDVPDIIESSMALLKQISNRFEEAKLEDLLASDPTAISLELIKAGCDGNEIRKAKVKEALYITCKLLSPESRSGPVRHKRSTLVARFLEQNVLGLTVRLNEVINDTLKRQLPMLERQRSIAVMEYMITLSKPYTGKARPQISACLLSALGVGDLRSAALSCWHTLLRCIEEAEVEMLLETTFIIVSHYWANVDGKTRTRMETMLEDLLKNQVKLLSAYANKLPSLAHIDDLAEISARFERLRTKLSEPAMFALFVKRLSHENPSVVHKALVELTVYLGEHQAWLQASVISEQPDKIVASLSRALLDCSARYNGWQASDDAEAGVVKQIGRLCAEALGLVGCLDPNRVGGVGKGVTAREQRHFVVANNFQDPGETTDFVVFMLEHVLVKVFTSATDTKFQGFLSWAMQELLDRVDLPGAVKESGAGVNEPTFRKWLAMSEEAREVLTPFLTSHYSIQALAPQPAEYPVVRPGRPYESWIHTLVLDLLGKYQTVYSGVVFRPLCRLIKVPDLTVAEFLLPYVVLHVVVGEEESSNWQNRIKAELAGVFKYEAAENASYEEREQTKPYYEAGFRILDYFLRWIQTKKAQATVSEPEQQWVARVQGVIDSLDPELVSQRAIDCKDYARALFFLEPFMHKKANEDHSREHTQRMLKQLQNIYANIDDPDGLDGIVFHLAVEDLGQQATNHLKAGRWTVAQTWFEIQLADSPEDVDIQLDLLKCLKESGQHDVLLNVVKPMQLTSSSVRRIIPYAAEASWATGRWQTLADYVAKYPRDVSEVFNIGVAQALLFLKEPDRSKFTDLVRTMRDRLAGLMTYSATSSMLSSHDVMLKCHVLSDLEIIARNNSTNESGGGREQAFAALTRRLDVLGADVSGKQYLLGIRRAAMELAKPQFVAADISTLWLTSARLARKSGLMHQSFNAVLRAQQLGDPSASIEYAKLLYKEGHHRNAIQTLEHSVAVIDRQPANQALPALAPSPALTTNLETEHSVLKARTLLLLAKWQDSTGQTHASALRSKYQEAARICQQWEKGHYYLGRHYKKVLESEKNLKPDQQSDEFLGGEMAKLVIENYMRSLACGTKYVYQTLPRILTLWLELGAQVAPSQAQAAGLLASSELKHRRQHMLKQLHKYLEKYIPRLPAYIFYTALPQIVARIAHPEASVFKLLNIIIQKVFQAHPRQSLWTLLPVITQRRANSNPSASLRSGRAEEIVKNLQASLPHSRADPDAAGGTCSLTDLVRRGEKLASQLLQACVSGDFSREQRTVTKSITRDLNFNHKCMPCPLVVPVEASLTATLPPARTDLTSSSSPGDGPASVARHKAFPSHDIVTMDSFLDEVLVLNSLAKPRKLTARGSDGRLYGLLIKPKDDLRTDQRLMEFNAQINRSLKRDAESSRRQLYVRTYAVTPLNEECGIIEWVDGLRTLRDILLSIYKTVGRQPNYAFIAKMLKDSTTTTDAIHIFTNNVLGEFPPVLPQWFAASFPAPSAWLAARLRYTRSCAVMSMVGTILGLGDRHGENVLLEEGNGGIFHVDFNCLFDKGKTFAQPECVPFRLTHNMVAAMGINGVEGAFRTSCERTLRVMRAQEETFITILEAFIHDPTLDLQRNKKRAAVAAAAGGGGIIDRLDPNGVVESIRRKIRGLLPNENIPLGIEGQVDWLIKEATSPHNLAAMYIGWCAFL